MKKITIIFLLFTFFSNLNAQRKDSILLFIKKNLIDEKPERTLNDRGDVFAQNRNENGKLNPEFTACLLETYFVRDTFGLSDDFRGLSYRDYMDDPTLTPMVVKRMMKNLKVIHNTYIIGGREAVDSLRFIYEQSIEYLGRINSNYITKEDKSLLMTYYNTASEFRQLGSIELLVGLNLFESIDDVFRFDLKYYNNEKIEKEFAVNGFEDYNTLLYYEVAAKLGDKRRLNVLIAEATSKKEYKSVYLDHLAFIKKRETIDVIIDEFFYYYNGKNIRFAKEYISYLVKTIEEIPMDYCFYHNCTDEGVEKIYKWLKKYRNNYKISNKYIIFGTHNGF